MAARDAEFGRFCLDQLRELGDVELRRMFGGAGLYSRGVFFAIVSGARLWFKTDETTRARYTEAGSEPFRPSAKQTLSSYYEVPDSVLERTSRLLEWAEEAIDCQRRALGAKLSRKRRR